MGFPRARSNAIAGPAALLLAGLLCSSAFSGCSLNPQPAPPARDAEEKPTAGSSNGQGDGMAASTTGAPVGSPADGSVGGTNGTTGGSDSDGSGPLDSATGGGEGAGPTSDGAAGAPGTDTSDGAAGAAGALVDESAPSPIR